MASLCIHSANVVRPSGVAPGGVLVGDDGKIAALLGVEEKAAANTVIDAAGRLLFPGFIDAHVHMRDPGFTQKEDFGSGSKAAAIAGVTTVMCMPNTNPPADTPDGVRQMVEAGEGASYVDFTVQGGVSHDNLDMLPELWASGVSSLEMFLSDTSDAYRFDDADDLAEALRLVAAAGAVVGIYTGDQRSIDSAVDRLKAQGRDDLAAFCDSRSAEAEVAGITTAIAAAGTTGARVVLRQVCSRAGFELVRRAKAGSGGAAIAAEVTPHHLRLTLEECARLGPFAQMIPPLRAAEDRNAAIVALRDGTVDFIGSDHAPHMITEKQGETAWTSAPGTPGLDTISVSALDLACAGKIAFKRLAQVLCARPAELFGVQGRKGTLTLGADGDLVLVDPDAEREITQASIHSRAGRSPFEGVPLRGWPVLTVLRGEVIAQDGRLVADRPMGRFVERAGSNRGKADVRP